MAHTLGRPLGFEAGSQDEANWHAALVKAFDAHRGEVCAVCGLGNVGHAPESKWLGFERHAFTPRPATAEDLEHARELTTAAYRARPEVA